MHNIITVRESLCFFFLDYFFGVKKSPNLPLTPFFISREKKIQSQTCFVAVVYHTLTSWKRSLHDDFVGDVLKGGRS